MIRHFPIYLRDSLYCISRRHICTKTSIVKTNKKMFKSSIFNLQEASSDQVQEFLNSFDTVLSDCDGKLF